MEFYQMDVKEVFSKLNTGKNGLAGNEAKTRLERYGYNALKEVKGPSAFAIFLNQFKNSLVIILIIATLISLVLGEYIDASAIFAIVILNAFLGLYQEYNAEKSIDALKKLQALKTIVIRDGKKIELEARELVPGDVVILEEGSKIPADSRLIEVINLQTVEGSLTGESTPVSKHVNPIDKAQVSERKNMVFSGTNVSRGRGIAVVVSTGMNTEIGKIAHLIETSEEKETPLQKQLANFGKWLGIIILAIAAIVFVGELVEAGTFFQLLQGQFDYQALVQTFIFAVSLAVAAIPEGLPAVVTIALALGVKRMVKRNALIRKLPAIESLGSTSVICADKTGTLTHNEMTVKEIYVNEKIVKITGEGYDLKGEFYLDNKQIDPRLLKLALDIGRLCNNASIQNGNVVGDPTEIALLVAAEKAGIKGEIARTGEIPFDSNKKYMATMHSISGKKMSYFKGAPEVILRMCNRINYEGRVRFLTKTEREKIVKINDDMASRALRVLAVAYKEGNGTNDLVFAGLTGMIDPPRAEVKEAIKRCEEAGIRVVMITGDHKLTAMAIAHEIGIKGKAITGEELDKMDDKMLNYEVDNISIYARVSPEHKVRILQALKKQGLVVAMTGDGVNDAPAIKNADIGISMGLTGTDVAREASDMVLVDDNFTSIVNAVEEGRGIYDNIKKFVLYLLSCNIAEVLVIFFAILLNWPLPLIAIQLLWVNLVTDGLPAVALGIDPAKKHIMKDRPRSQDEKIIDRKMLINILFSGTFMAIGVLYLFNMHRLTNIAMAQTVAFTSIVIFEMMRVYIIRSNYKLSILSNKPLLIAVVASVLLQIIVIYTPVINEKVFNSVPIGLLDWGWIILVGLVTIVIPNLLLKKIAPKMMVG